ncbi:MAG: hypothetical protein GXO50_03560 [Chlorobi bacterium]|nr:hypothetical protein [Chlorobiota bacterium]
MIKLRTPGKDNVKKAVDRTKKGISGVTVALMLTAAAMFGYAVYDKMTEPDPVAKNIRAAMESYLSEVKVPEKIEKIKQSGIFSTELNIGQNRVVEQIKNFRQKLVLTAAVFAQKNHYNSIPYIVNTVEVIDMLSGNNKDKQDIGNEIAEILKKAQNNPEILKNAFLNKDKFVKEINRIENSLKNLYEEYSIADKITGEHNTKNISKVIDYFKDLKNSFNFSGKEKKVSSVTTVSGPGV